MEGRFIETTALFMGDYTPADEMANKPIPKVETAFTFDIEQVAGFNVSNDDVNTTVWLKCSLSITILIPYVDFSRMFSKYHKSKNENSL